jgi:hypothetical protein
VINNQGLELGPELYKLQLSPLYYKGFTENIKSVYKQWISQHKLQGRIYVVIITINF